MTRLNELENLLTNECPKYENDCSSCPYSNECKEFSHLEMGYNAMCWRCQKFQRGCAGETSEVFTGCALRVPV